MWYVKYLYKSTYTVNIFVVYNEDAYIPVYTF